MRQPHSLNSDNSMINSFSSRSVYAGGVGLVQSTLLPPSRPPSPTLFDDNLGRHQIFKMFSFGSDTLRRQSICPPLFFFTPPWHFVVAVGASFSRVGGGGGLIAHAWTEIDQPGVYRPTLTTPPCLPPYLPTTGH